MNYYKTIADFYSEELIEKRSKFICSVKPVDTEELAVKFINEMKSQYWDARHNAYAYIIKDGDRKRYSDDGEPKSTAGLPMLEVLTKNNIVNIAAVVTRYFGGILLGTGGLVRAYSGAVKLTMSKAEILKMTYCKQCNIIVNYAIYERINTVLLNSDAMIDNCAYASNVKIKFHIQVDEFDRLISKLNDAVSGNFSIETLQEDFMPYLS